ncbi:MAG: helicase C-terminal domain-containing protein [Pseudomonadales bacterium]
MSRTTRTDPGSISTIKKEAVAEGLLGGLLRQICATGENGRLILGEKPSSRLTSGFLLPANPDELGLDDESSPIRITSSGFDIMIANGVDASITARVDFGIFIRILPTRSELESNPVVFRLTPEVDRQMRADIRSREREVWQSQCERWNNDRRNPEWLDHRERIRLEAHERFGIRSAVEIVDAKESEEVEGDPESQEVTGFSVRPGDQQVPPSEVVRHERPLDKWTRIDINSPSVQIDLSPDSDVVSQISEANRIVHAAIERSLSSWLRDPDESSGGLFCYPRGRTFNPQEIAEWDATLEGIREERAALPDTQLVDQLAIPRIALSWDIRSSIDWSDPNRRVLHLAIENRSQRPRQNSVETDEAIFCVSVNCNVPRRVHRYMRLDRVKPSYRFNEHLRYAALGFNAGVLATESEDEVRLETDWMPRYRLPRIEPQTHGVDCTFSALSDPSTALSAIEELPDKLESWVDSLDVDPTTGLDPSDTTHIELERSTIGQDLEAWRFEAHMIDRGITLLRQAKDSAPGTDAHHPFAAWLLMNKTMRLVAGNRYTSWRLFQVAFILSAIPSIATRLSDYSDFFEPTKDDLASLLYFSTGGGKSEAFFGLLVFNLFLDRLRGKLFGVTSMIRYPLRLLTIQQAQRASKVLAKAEIVRKEEGVTGEPFSIGFWVGSGNTPNQHSAPGVSDIPEIDTEEEEDTLLRDNRKYRNAIEDWRKLPECPFCGSETGLRRTSSSGSPLGHGVLGHVCFNARCDWNSSDSWPFLPFFIVDDDIYSYAPSVLIGTVDKLALIGQNPRTIRKVFGMFGFAPWMDEQTGRLITPTNAQLEEFQEQAPNAQPVFPTYQTGRQVFFDPYPSLLIQDEAHLLEESLGTFAGLFETTLLKAFRELAQHVPSAARDNRNNVRLPKVVAATATVSDPARQIESLYQKQLLWFPRPGPDLYSSFYAAPVESTDPAQRQIEDLELRAQRRRVYATVLTNGKPHTTASVAVLSAFHLIISKLMSMLLEDDDADEQLVRKFLVTALPHGGLHAPYANAIQASNRSELATLIDLHRIALTYVTNKKGGDQILAAEWEQVRKDHQREGLSLDDFERELITGSVDAGLIQRVIERAEDRPNSGEEFADLDHTLRSIVATSAISHGVDVEELNSMFFAGMPSDIAEYIQASSRVGRSHVGFSLLLPVPQRKRDRYIVETHHVFHRFLERMIQPPAIDRWAENAINRVVPSFFQTYLMIEKAIPELIAAEPNQKSRVPSYGRVSDIRTAAQDPARLRRIIADFIAEAIGLGTQYAPPNSEYYRELIQIRVRGIWDNMQDPDMQNLALRDFFEEVAKRSPETLERPMTSLRDVDVPGSLVPYLVATGAPRRRLDADEFQELMRFLRRGTGGIDDE